MDEEFMDEEEQYREEHGTFPVNDVVCDACLHRQRRMEDDPFCWDCDAGSLFQPVTRNLEKIHRMLMLINTTAGEALQKGEGDSPQSLMRIGFAEGLKWIVKPYATEEQLYDEFGFEYTSIDDFNPEDL